MSACPNPRLGGEMFCDEGGGMGLRGFVAAEAGKPADVGVFAEPGELAFGVVAMALCGLGNGLVAGDVAAQDGDGLRVAERGEGAAVEAVLLDQDGRLFDEAA